MWHRQIVLEPGKKWGEAELHVMRARLRGGLLNKARRGELRSHLPVGLVYADDGKVVLDPEHQVVLLQEANRVSASADS